jgi:hypothetical protein
MLKNKPLLIVVGLIIIGLLSYGVWSLLPGLFHGQAPQKSIDDNLSFDLNAKAQGLKVISPRPKDTVASPLVITGEARGWYFEGSFPVALKDANGATLAIGVAQAQGDWMSADYVPFKAELNFPAPKTPLGMLVLRKDNPSGLPVTDAGVSFPVVFSASAPKASLGPCLVGGCSGQVCTDDPNLGTTCEWLEEYACYKAATCARQQNGECGWTQTQKLKDCIANKNRITD